MLRGELNAGCKRDYKRQSIKVRTLLSVLSPTKVCLALYFESFFKTFKKKLICFKLNFF